MPPLASSVPQLSRQQLAAFAEDGFLVVRTLIDGDLLQQVQAGYSKAVAGAYDDERWAGRRREDGLLQLPRPHEVVTELQDHAHIERMCAVGQQLLGPNISFWYDQLIFKPAGNRWETPWHQDSGYWHRLGEDLPALTAWLAVEDVDEDMGCMTFVPGSHKRGILQHSSVSDRNPINNALEAVGVDGREGVKVPLRAGDVSFHHCKTLHYTAGNAGRRDRKGLVNHLADLAFIDNQTSG